MNTPYKAVVWSYSIAVAIFFILFFLLTLQAKAEDGKVEGIDILDYGLYTSEDLFQSEEESTITGTKIYWDFDSLSLFKETDQIPAVLGLKFGIRYIVKGSPSGDTIPITYKVLLPGLINPETGEKLFVDEGTSTEKIGISTYVGYVFEREWELVPGKWTIQLYHGTAKLAEQEFTVREYSSSLDTLLAEYYYSSHLLLESWENFQNRRYMGGTKHNNNITLILSKEGHELSGYLTYAGSSERHDVHGTIDRRGNAVFAEYEDINKKPERAYKGKFDDTFEKFTGIWIRNIGDPENPVMFRTTEQIMMEGFRSSKQKHKYQEKLLIKRLISDLDKSQIAVFLLSRMKSKWVTSELLRVMKGKTAYCSYEIRNFLEVLKGKKDNQIVELVIPMLVCSDANIRALAAEVLGNQRNNHAIAPLITLLVKDENGFVREKAGRALTKIGKPAVEPLLTALKEKIALNSESLWTLGEMKDRRAIPLLMQYLRDDNNDIRREAARALGKIGKPAIKYLLAAFKDRDDKTYNTELPSVTSYNAIRIRDSEVYLAAVEAFANMGSIAVPSLIAALKSEDPRQRSGVIDSLGELRDSRAVEPLIAEFRDTVDWVRIHAADALSKIGKPAIPSLLQVLHSEEPSLRRLAIRGLSRIKDPSIVEPLIGALNDSSDDIRRSATYGLGELGDRRAIEPLMTALIECQTKKAQCPLHEHEILIRALDRFKDARAVGLLIKEMDIEKGSTYYYVKHALIQIGAPAVKEVSRLLKEGSGRERQAAIDILQGIGGLTAAEALRAALNDKDPVVRSGAAHALGSIKDTGAGDLLLVALNDTEPAVRVRAIEALGNIEDVRAVGPLLSALADKNAEVKLVAIMSLKKFKDDRAIEPLVNVIKGEDIGVLHDSVYYKLHQEASRCLQEITGEFRTFPEGWKAWWLNRQRRNQQ